MMPPIYINKSTNRLGLSVFVAMNLVLWSGLSAKLWSDEEFKPVPRLQWLPQPDGVTSLQLDGRELTAVHYDSDQRRVFWHPIRAKSDISLTRMGHPHDPFGHSHHNSVWISHSDVDGINFWGDKGKKLGRIVNQQIPREAYEDGDASASMLMLNEWRVDDDERILLLEKRLTTIHIRDDANSWFMIVDLELTTPKGASATFNPSGFGLMAVRMAKAIGVHDGGGRILNAEGLVNEKAVFRKPTKWCDYSGRISNAQDGSAGITLFNHPNNPEHPTPFHVRDDGWMGACLNLERPIVVTEGSPLWCDMGFGFIKGFRRSMKLRRSLPSLLRCPRPIFR